jgi:hypothetical protein
MVQPPAKQISANKVDGTTKGDCKKMGIVQQEGIKDSHLSNSEMNSLLRSAYLLVTTAERFRSSASNHQ